MQNLTALTAPAEGRSITCKSGRLIVPDDPISPFIEGNRIGPDIWRASALVIDAAIAKARGGTNRIVWFEVPPGERAAVAWRVPAERYGRGGSYLQCCNQGSTHDASRRRDPQLERDAAASARPLRVRARSVSIIANMAQ
jgi:hypothetical protein